MASMSISLKALEKKIKTNIRPCSIEEFTKFLVICIGSMLGVLLLVYQLYARYGLHFGEKYHGETLSERYTNTKRIGKVSDFGDYPTHWELSLEPAWISRENTVHYTFNTRYADEEWNTTLPSGGTLLHLGPDLKPFTLGMFHEIRCLNIIRKTLAAYYADESEDSHIQNPQLAHHCMNYLRQMVLCRRSLRLQSVRASRGNHVTAWDVTDTCLDWTMVYDAAEKNYQDYLHHLKVCSDWLCPHNWVVLNGHSGASLH